MDVACPNCPAMYPISEQKLAGRLVRFRCKACGHAIVVDGRLNPSQSPPSQAGQARSAAPVPQDSVPVSELYPTGSPAAPSAPTRLQPPPLPESFYSGQPESAPPSFAGGPPSGQAPLGQPPSATSAPPRSGPEHPGQPFRSSYGPSFAPPGTANADHRYANRGRGPDVDAELDPSVYEDETVAMTAHELEAVADAKSQHPPAAPPQFRSQPPPKPLSSVPPSALPSVSGPEHAAGPNPAAPPSSGPAPALPNAAIAPSHTQPPRRAESWNVGQAPGMHLTTQPPAQRLPPAEPQPAIQPAIPITTEAPPLNKQRGERRWVFPALLILLGAGGLFLGGLLGKTWLAELWGARSAPAPTSPPTATTSDAPANTPALPAFDAAAADSLLQEAAANAVNCLNADTAPLTGVVRARFSTSGKLEALDLSGSVTEASEGPCIRSVFEKVTVPPFQGGPAQVEKPLELRPRPESNSTAQGTM